MYEKAIEPKIDLYEYEDKVSSADRALCAAYSNYIKDPKSENYVTIEALGSEVLESFLKLVEYTHSDDCYAFARDEDHEYKVAYFSGLLADMKVRRHSITADREPLDDAAREEVASGYRKSLMDGVNRAIIESQDDEEDEDRIPQVFIDACDDIIVVTRDDTFSAGVQGKSWRARLKRSVLPVAKQGAVVAVSAMIGVLAADKLKGRGK